MHKVAITLFTCNHSYHAHIMTVALPDLKRDVTRCGDSHQSHGLKATCTALQHVPVARQI